MLREQASLVIRSVVSSASSRKRQPKQAIKESTSNVVQLVCEKNGAKWAPEKLPHLPNRALASS
jgi:hypothetical protein